MQSNAMYANVQVKFNLNKKKAKHSNRTSTSYFLYFLHCSLVILVFEIEYTHRRISFFD